MPNGPFNRVNDPIKRGIRSLYPVRSGVMIFDIRNPLIDEFIASIQDTASLAELGRIGSFLHESMNDAEFMGYLDHITPSAVAFALACDPPDCQSFRDHVLWIVGADRTAQGPALKLKPTHVESKAIVPLEPVDKRVYITRGLHVKQFKRKDGSLGPPRLMFGGTFRGVPVNPKLHGDTGPYGNLMRPDDPRIPYLSMLVNRERAFHLKETNRVNNGKKPGKTAQSAKKKAQRMVERARFDRSGGYHA